MHHELGPNGIRIIDDTKELLSTSKLESSARAQTGDALQMLSLLGMLANDTRQSIAPILQAEHERNQPKPETPAPAPAAEAQAPPVTAQAQAPAISVPPAQPRFDSKHPEYKPALKDDLLVRALLQLSERREAMRVANRAPSQTRGRGFQQASVPDVPVAPKPAPLGGGRRPGTQTIFRSGSNE